MKPDVIVVGAGVIGTSIAYQLVRAGVRVTVLDRGRVGDEATGASAGMIQVNPEPSTPPDLAALQSESARLFPALATELLDRTGMDVGLRGAPLLHVALREGEDAGLRVHRGWQAEHGIPVAWVDRASALDLEPALNPDIHGALHYPENRQVMPRHLARALARAAVDLGAVLREGSAVDRLLTQGDRVVGVAIGAESISSAEVVIANGAWASAWSEALGIPIPVRPVRGQMVALRCAGTALRTVVSSSEGYVLTKPDGSTYVGTTVEEAGYDARPTTAGIAGLLARAPRMIPRLADATFVSAWAGLRPGTPDGLPLLGRVPGWQGATIAAGHFRDGILLAPITGELIADLLCRRRPRLPIDAFDPSRFLARAA